MDTNRHNHTELNNVTETWDRNEQERMKANGQQNEQDSRPMETRPATELDRITREEAKEYDNEKIEDRLLGGNRASVNDL